MSRDRVIGLIIGFLCGALAVPALAEVVTWSRVEVTPVVMVEEHDGRFYPTTGSPAGQGWGHNEVIPMCEVKSAFGKFTPTHGGTDEWTKGEVRPTVIVTPSFGVFSPVEPH